MELDTLLRHPHQGRSYYAFTKHIAILDYIDNMTTRNLIGRFMRNRFVKSRVKSRAFSVDAHHAFTIQKVMKLSDDQLNAACPSVISRSVLHCAFQVIQH